MNVIVAAVVGFFAGRMLWLALRKTWHRPALVRANYQGASVPTGAGIVLALSVLLVEAGRAVFGAAGIGDDTGMTAARAAVLALAFGYAAFGLLDDLLDKPERRGLNAQLLAVGRGELTAGSLSVVGTAAVAIVAVAAMAPASLGALVVQAAIVALAANLAGTFDVRPGRASKLGLLAFVVLAVATGFAEALVPVAVVVGAAAALMLDDLHERLMLGRTGSGVLGGAIGLGLAVELGGSGRLIVLALLLGLNLLSEVVSFSKMFETIPPLRALDRMGRKRPATIDIRDVPSPGPVPSPVDMEPTPRTETAFARATVGGAHEARATGSPGLREQRPYPSSESKDPGATRPFGPDAGSWSSNDPTDLFGFDRRPDVRPQPEREHGPDGPHSTGN